MRLGYRHVWQTRTVDPLLADHSLWHTHGETVIWIAAVVAAIGVIFKTPIGQAIMRAVKWVWRRVVSEPITEWGKRTVGSVVEEKVGPEFTNNGGSSMRDAIDGIVDSQATFAVAYSESAVRQEALAEVVADNKSMIETIHRCLDRRFAGVDARIERLTDMAERVLVEQIGSKTRVRQLFRAIEVPVFETDTNGWFLYVNPAYSKLTGLTAEESLGEGWAQALHPEDRDRVFQMWNLVITEGKSFGAIYRFRNVQTGEVTEVRGSASALHDSTDAVVGFIGTLDPILPPSSLPVEVAATIGVEDDDGSQEVAR